MRHLLAALCLVLLAAPAAFAADAPATADLFAPESLMSTNGPETVEPADGLGLELGVQYAACTYFCTGEPCPNGQMCAQCCTSEGVNCGPLTCVDACIWPRDL